MRIVGKEMPFVIRALTDAGKIGTHEKHYGMCGTVGYRKIGGLLLCQ